MHVGYVEAFTDAEVTHLLDVNAGAHRVNKAVLPHFRARRAGVLMYVGSTIPVRSDTRRRQRLHSEPPPPARGPKKGPNPV